MMAVGGSDAVHFGQTLVGVHEIGGLLNAQRTTWVVPFPSTELLPPKSETGPTIPVPLTSGDVRFQVDQ